MVRCEEREGVLIRCSFVRVLGLVKCAALRLVRLTLFGVDDWVNTCVGKLNTGLKAVRYAN